MLQAVRRSPLGEPKSWADAEEACHWLGSDVHLASITSKEQQAAVTHLTDGTAAWIGLNDIAEEGSFVWADDEPLEYTRAGTLAIRMATATASRTCINDG